MKRTFLLVIGVVLAAVGVSQAVKPEDSYKDYRKWKRVTEQPVDMTVTLALSCVGPKPQDGPPNPHTSKAFLVYVNPVGEKMMSAWDATSYPVGTVIVKEKYDREQLGGKPFERVDPAKLKNAKPELLTIMVKGKSGWQYLAADGRGKLQKGDTSYCRSCHEMVQKQDYVFRPYVYSR